MKRQQGDVGELLSRARSEGATPRELERRHIYNGDPQAHVAGYAVRANRKAVRRTRSTFNMILALFAGGVAIVLYISNILAVNTLVREVNQLQAQYEKIASANQMLRAEIDSKSGLERIGKVATDLGLRYPKDQPVWFDVDEERLDEIEKNVTP